jgi:hypothetical protein
MPKYDPPHGLLDDLFTWSTPAMERNDAENEAYDTEWHRQRGADDYASGRYREPNGVLEDLTTWSSAGMEKQESQNEAYRSGWFAAKARTDARSK